MSILLDRPEPSHSGGDAGKNAMRMEVTSLRLRTGHESNEAFAEAVWKIVTAAIRKSLHGAIKGVSSRIGSRSADLTCMPSGE